MKQKGRTQAEMTNAGLYSLIPISGWCKTEVIPVESKSQFQGHYRYAAGEVQ